MPIMRGSKRLLIKLRSLGYGVTLLLLLLLSISPGIASAELFSEDSRLIEITSYGEINWERGLIRATGSSTKLSSDQEAPSNIAVNSLALTRAAKINAMRNALELIKTIRVDSSSHVEESMTSSEYVRNKIHETIRKSQIVEKSHRSEETLDLVIELSMSRPFIETIIGDTGGLAVATVGSELHSGMIIDASGLDANPALSPRILDENRREIYGASYIKRDYFSSKGIVSYRSALEDARNSSRAGNDPIIIKALRTSGTGKSDLIISNADASRLKANSPNLSYLEKGNVVIVID